MLFSLPDFTFLQGTISDQTGAFNIKSNETKGILPISSVGYSTILLPCTSSNMGTIQLYSDYTLVQLFHRDRLNPLAVKLSFFITYDSFVLWRPKPHSR